MQPVPQPLFLNPQPLFLTPHSSNPPRLLFAPKQKNSTFFPFATWKFVLIYPSPRHSALARWAGGDVCFPQDFIFTI
jgi:hypothetical protein